jgi:signal transduction histidine kinase
MTTDAPPRLVDLVPVETLEQLARMFHLTVGVPMVFTCSDGVPLTSVPDPLAFCATLVRAEGGLCLRRKKWDVPEHDLEHTIRTRQSGSKPVHHRCLGGFEDMAVPIIVEGRGIGFAVFSRSRTEPPGTDEFRSLAEQGGMPPEVGEAVAARTMVMAPQQVTHIAEFLQVITNLVASAAYDTMRARRVMELEKLRDDLTNMIVHDLRTPLTAIIGSLQTATQMDFDPELLQELIPISLSSAQTLLEMVNTLLDISKMEAGQMELNVTEVDVQAVVDEALDLVRGVALERHHELASSVDGQCRTVRADAEKLRRTLVNLLGNALKFTPDGGRVALAGSCDEGGLTLSVTDNGPGIPPEYRERIFEKFGQVEARSEGHKHSTGLGLTFCKMVAEAHGGRVWVESEVGKGSRFSVFIPAS